MLDAWRSGRGFDAAPPARTRLSPLLWGPLAPQMFVLAEERGGWRFRTAGALLDDLHGRCLVGEPFEALWAEADRPAVRDALTHARRSGAPRIAEGRGETPRGGAVRLELTLAPVLGPGGEADRCLGLYQPLSPLARLEGGVLGLLRLAAPAPPSRLRLVVDNTRARP